MDWLGDLGGIEGILADTFVLFFGGYLQFNAILSSLNSLNIEDCN